MIRRSPQRDGPRGPRLCYHAGVRTGARSRSQRVLCGLGLAALLLAAYLAGILTERMRFDAQRDAVLRRLDTALRDYQRRLMEAESGPAQAPSKAEPAR
jgi:hypothetical protein